MEDKSDTSPLISEQYPHIKSFARRRGHLSKGQEKALVEGLPKWGLAYTPATPIVATEIFQREAPLWLEIGFGMGETTEQIVLANPEVNYIGVEVYPPGVGAMLKRIEESNITNMRVINHDVVDVINHMIPDDSLDKVMIYFPDPWRKSRHHKRRLIQPPFIKLLLTKIKPGGILHCATDWENYAEHMLEVLQNCDGLSNLFDTFAPRPAKRPLTKFENRGLKLGHQVWDLLYTKN